MKLNRHSLRRLIENVVQEDADVSKFKKGKGMSVRAKEAAADNKAAFEVADVDAIKEKLGIRISGKYYVWKGSQAEPGYKLGSVRYSEGDPYTYEALSGGYYRVMSGPDSDKKRDNGKRIGTTPIGAKFKPSNPPQVQIAAMLELTFDGKGNGNPTVKTANGILTAEVEDDAQGIIQKLKDYLGMGGSPAVNQMKSLSQEPLAFFGPQCGERGQNLAKFKAYIEAQNSGDRGISSALEGIKTRKFKVSGTDTPEPDGGNAANESFSRGSLLRNRYGRY